MSYHLETKPFEEEKEEEEEEKKEESKSIPGIEVLKIDSIQ